MSRKTDRKALKQSSGAFAKAFYNSPVLFAITSLRDGSFVEVNESFLRLFEYSRDEVIGSTPLELNLYDISEDRAAVLRLLKERGAVRNFEAIGRTKAGRPVALLFSADVVSIDGKERVVGSAIDITERKAAEERLRESEAKYRSLFENSLDGVFLTVPETGEVLAANPAACSMLGMTQEEICKAGRAGIVVQDESAARGLEERSRLGRWLGELTYRRKDGSTFLGELSCRFFTGSHGTTMSSMSFRDIAERKEAEKKLQESEAMLARAQQMAHVGHWDRDLSTGILRWSDETYRIFGVTPVEGDLDMLSFLQVIHPEDRPYVEKALLDAIEGVRPYDAVFRVVHPDGSVRYVHGKGEVTRNADGKPLRIFGTTLDITERKQMEEELRKSRDELEQRVQERTEALRESERIARMQLAEIEAYYNMAPVGLAILDRDLRYVRINERLAEMHGISVEAHLGRTVREAMPEIADRVEEAARRIFKSGEPVRGIDVIPETHTRTGTERTWRATYFPLRNAAGQIEGIGGIAEEITEQKRLEEQLHQSDKMAAIGVLAGGIAHDFNNMLAVIIGNAELALDEMHDGSNESGYHIEQILKASKRATDLVRHILTFSRKSERQQKPLKLGPLLKETAKLLRGSLLSTVRIKLNIDTDEDAILADPAQVQQVLMNLATNAAQAMGEDGGTLTIGLAKAELGEGDPTLSDNMEPGHYVRLTMHDTGIGIPRELRERIFEPFFTTKEPGQGTGMGLAVVYGIIKSHGGAITVDSKAGKGSTFGVYFPAIEGIAEETTRKRDRVPTGAERVLVVDDESSVLRTASETLKRLGYRVTTAGSGAEGWKTFESDPQAFDLVMTDQVMPEMTGMRFAQRMLEVRADVPIILFTGYAEVSSEQARAAGISEFLMKPFSKQRLAETVRRVLDGRTIDCPF